MNDESGLLKTDFENAIHSQSACNLSGLLYSFSDVMQRIRNEAKLKNKGTDWINSHPICRLYAEQVYHLTRKTDWLKAYRECENMLRK